MSKTKPECGCEVPITLPIKIVYCPMHRAAGAMLEALKAARQHLEYVGYGDSWERGVALDADGAYAEHGGLRSMIEKAIAQALGEEVKA